MSTLLRGLVRPLVSQPLHSIRTVTTQVPAASPREEEEGGRPSDVAPLPDERDMAVTAEVVSGAPVELRHRVVRIYQPTRNTMQSGGAKGGKWRIDWDVLPGGGRWQNPLMGWASSADYMQGTRILYSTKEDAIRFAEKQGWDYYVQPPPVKRIPPKNYSENFLYRPGKLRIVRTK